MNRFLRCAWQITVLLLCATLLGPVTRRQHYANAARVFPVDIIKGTSATPTNRLQNGDPYGMPECA